MHGCYSAGDWVCPKWWRRPRISSTLCTPKISNLATWWLNFALSPRSRAWVPEIPESSGSNMIKSADPGLCQGRGGAWDHRRCGTWLSGRKQRHTPSRQHLCQLHAPAIYMPLPFARPQTLQTLRRPPRQQLLQLHALAICFSGGSRQVCLASNPPNASAGLQGNNSYSYYMPLPSVFQGVQDCRLPGLKPPKRFQPSRRPPRQQLLQLHAPAIYFSRGSIFQGVQDCRLRQQLLQLLHAPCHLFFRGFKTAVCPASNPPNASNPPAGLQGNNSYSYMPLPSILFFKGFKTAVCLASNPPNASAGFQGNNSYSYIHAPAICFSGGSSPPSHPPNASAGFQGNNSYSYMSLPSVFQGVQDSRLPGLKLPKRFQPSRRPPRQQLLLTATTCPCHLFFRGFKTAVCPASNPPNASNPPAGLQGNNSYLTATTCPCHLFFRGFKTAVCPASNPPNASNPPAGLQGNNSYSYMPLPSILFFKGFKTAVCLASNPPNASAGFQGNNSYSYIHAPAICFSGGSSPPSHPPNASAGFQGNNSYSYMSLPSVFQGVQDSRLPGLKLPKRFQPSRRPPRQQLLSYSYYMPLPSVFQGVQDCRLPGLKPPKRFQPSRRPPRQQLLQLHAPAIYFSRGSIFQGVQDCRLRQQLLQLLHAPCHLFFRGFKTAVCPASNPPNASNPPAGLQGNNSYSYMPLPSVFQGVQDCRLPGLKPSKRFRRLPRQQLLQLHTCPCHLFFRGFKPALTPSERFRRLPRQQLLQLHVPALFFRGFKTAVCPASNPPNASNPPAGLQGNNSYSYMPLPSIFQGVQDCRLPGLKPPKRFQPPAGLQGNNSYSYYMPLPSVFQGVQDCRLPGLKPPKRFQPSRRPPRQQLLQLHAPAIYFSRGSRLPFKATTLTATTCPCHLFFRGFKTAVCPASNPQASKATTKATTLTATCPCHLFFRGFKTAVCPASNLPNASNPPAGLQGNNSYSYMPLPSIFQGVQDCRLPGLKPSKRFRRLPRQQLLQLHTCPCHLFFRGFKPALTPSKRFRRLPRQQLLQLHVPAICFSGGSRLPFARPQTPQTLPTLPQASKATTLILQLLHAPAICFSGGSRLPFARPQTPQTLPTLPQASKATTLTLPLSLFLSLSVSLSLSLALSHFFFGNWTLSWGLHPVAGRSWKTRSTKHELFSGSYESQEERDVICCGIPSKQSWLLRLWSPGAVLVKFQVAYPCFFGNKARSCVSLTI